MTNTIKHIKDNAEYVTLESTTDIKNVQQFFNEVGDWSLKTNGLPIATESIQGIRRLATQQEVDDGLTDNIVTPKTLEVRLRHPQATESNSGLVQYTKNSEALTFNNLTGATPKTVKYMFENIKATELQLGTSRLATKSQAEAGVSDDVVITPLKLKQGIAALVPGYGASSESVLGLTKLATVAQVREGVIREGFAISPYTFANLSGNETQSGVFKVAKQSEMSGVSDSLVITPKKLNSYLGNYKGSDSNYGFVKLTNDINNTDSNTALRPNSNIILKTGGVFIGDIYKTSINQNNKYPIISEVDSKINLTKNQLMIYINELVNSSITQAMNTKVIGINQKWINVIGSRRSGVKYKNTTGKPIMVFAGGDLASSEHSFVIDGVSTRYRDWNAGSFLSFIVPSGSSYAINGTFYAGSTFWLELR